MLHDSGCSMTVPCCVNLVAVWLYHVAWLWLQYDCTYHAAWLWLQYDCTYHAAWLWLQYDCTMLRDSGCSMTAPCCVTLVAVWLHHVAWLWLQYDCTMLRDSGCSTTLPCCCFIAYFSVSTIKATNKSITAQQLLVSPDILYEVPWLYSDTPQTVELLWTSDRTVAETSANKQHSRQTDIHDLRGFETTIPARQRPQTHALDRPATRIPTNK